jgi:hypothetical protein
MRVATTIATVLLIAALLGACGSDDGGGSETTGAGAGAGGAGAPAGAAALECNAHARDAEELRATGIACPWARALMFRWQGSPACAPAADASRSSCRIGAYRCLGAVNDRGISVSCAQRGRSVAFLARGWAKA